MSTESQQVTAAIVVRNGERFLTGALQSIVRQTRPPDEVLLIDGQSTDRTAQIAQSFPGVRYMLQPDLGIANARNLALAAATGDFIAFLDADDAWAPEKLSVQLEALRADQFAFSARTETDEHLKPLRLVRGGFRGSLLEGLLFHGNVVGTPSSVVAPRQALLDAGGFDPRLSMCADWDMWIRLATRLSGVYSDDSLVLYRVHGSSMSTNLRVYESDSRYMLAKAFELPLPDEIKARRTEATARMWEVLAACYWEQGAIADAFRCASRSIQTQPSRLASLAFSVPFRMARRAMGLNRKKIAFKKLAADLFRLPGPLS